MTILCSSPGDISQAGDTCPVPPGVQGGHRALGAAVGRGLALPPALRASCRKAEEFIITFPPRCAFIYQQQRPWARESV